MLTSLSTRTDAFGPMAPFRCDTKKTFGGNRSIHAYIK